jgi:hypothetical protein
MPNRPPRRHHRPLVPWVVAAFFMQSLDGTILNTALPAMAQIWPKTHCACRV